jgi:cellulose biosynthesis protein BcsQ
MVLKPLQKEYDLIILDCPPTINILAENIFNATDVMLVPLIPTTLSIRTYKQMLEFFAEQPRKKTAIAPFLSMVDRRKKLHRELAAELPDQVDGLLVNQIPYLSQVEQMGVHRAPLPEFAPSSRAAAAYRNLWDEIEAGFLG